MRSILISVVLASAAVAAVFSAAACSSSGGSSPPSSDDGGATSSSSGGSSSGSSSGTACVPYESDADTSSPTVSFSKDVMPLFEHSCGLSTSCHYDPSQIGTLGVFLGCDDTYDAGANSTYVCNYANPGPLVYFYLVGGPPPPGGLPGTGPDAGPLVPLEITGMPFIKPGDPEQSYLMHKIDNDLCSLTGCVTNNTAVNNEMDQPGMLGPNDPPNWCGTSMPLNGEPLPAGPACGGSQDCTAITSYTRDTVRLWIAQGAMNN